MNLEFIRPLLEGARTPHPEDFIFSGSSAAMDAINGIVGAVQNPQTVSIKWDGSPAIIFGRRPADGKFTMNYKEYITSPGGQVTSSQELYKFFADNGKNPVVAEKLAAIFPAVASIVPQGFKGFVQGDLMWSDPLQLQGNNFVFKPNPYGVTYTVDKNSPIGKEIAGRTVGLAVHSYGTDIEPSKESPLVGRQSMQGLGGLTGTNNVITVFTGNMNTQFKMREPVQIKNAAVKAVNAFAALGGDEFLSGLTQATRNALQTYYNRKVTGQAVNNDWLQSKLSKGQYAIVAADENKPIVAALDKVYSAIIQLKLAILAQLEPQVKGIGQSVGDVPKGEGFNIDTPSGFIKLVNRGVFSAANFAGRS